MDKYNMPGNPDQVGYPGETSDMAAYYSRRQKLTRGVMTMANMRKIQQHLEGKRVCAAMLFNDRPF